MDVVGHAVTAVVVVVFVVDGHAAVIVLTEHIVMDVV